MNKEQQDKTLLKWREILDKEGIPFYLNQSTCLAIYRDGKMFSYNRSVDLAILADDLSSEKITLLSNYKYLQHETKQPYGILYFDTDEKTQIAGCEIQVVYFKDEWAFYNLGLNICLVWDRKHLDKKNWGKVKYLGLEWNVPGGTDEYLAHTYGDDWKTPRSSWNWIAEQKNICSWESIMAGKPVISDYNQVCQHLT